MLSMNRHRVRRRRSKDRAIKRAMKRALRGVVIGFVMTLLIGLACFAYTPSARSYGGEIVKVAAPEDSRVYSAAMKVCNTTVSVKDSVLDRKLACYKDLLVKQSGKADVSSF